MPNLFGFDETGMNEDLERMEIDVLHQKWAVPWALGPWGRAAPYT
jgi:hypothetical protein